MNWIETVLFIFLVFIIVGNLITEPKLSKEYFGVSIRTGKKIVGWIVKTTLNLFNKDNNETNQNQTR